MKDERFKEILDGIYQELLKANLHFRICWGINRASKDIVKGRNVHLTFFYYTMWANNDRFCLAIYNVIKPEKDTANFCKLFNYIRSNLSNAFILEKEIGEMEERIESHDVLLKKLKVIRDQYIAHTQLTKAHFEEENTYTYEEGMKLLVDLNDILNDLSYKYDNSRYGCDEMNLLGVSPHLEVDVVLRHLTEYYNARTQR